MDNCTDGWFYRWMTAQTDDCTDGQLYRQMTVQTDAYTKGWMYTAYTSTGKLLSDITIKKFFLDPKLDNFPKNYKILFSSFCLKIGLIGKMGPSKII